MKKAIRFSQKEYGFRDQLLDIQNPLGEGISPDLNKTLDTVSKVRHYTSRFPNFRVFWKSEFIQGLFDLSDETNWVDIERNYFIEIRRIVRYYNDSKKNNENQKVKLIELNNQMEFLRKKLCEYLTELEMDYFSKKNNRLQKLLFEDFKNKDFQMFSDSAGVSLLSRSDITTLFLNFNYTSVIRAYLDGSLGSEENFLVNQIHGTISDINSIIFGFGDEMDDIYDQIEKLNENEFFRFIKSFSYFKTSNYWDLEAFVESAKFQVYVMGHSCGLSDRTMLNTIFEHENCRSIKLFYHQKDDGTNNFTELTHEISRHFKDKATMRRKIVPFELSEPLPNYKPDEKT